ncbi:MAG TPA: methyltransferase [Candidatus Binataceae bacterium]|nr:methyltransferase [Candidatus Binataceae bacterium]
MASNILEATADTILGGALTIAQPSNGYRFAIDSILLARFADIRPRDRVLELGAGCGVISITIAATRHPRHITALELHAELVELIIRNAALNNCHHVAALHADLRHRMIRSLTPGSFDAVVANPPYRAIATGRASPNPARRAARGESHATLDAFIRAASRYCKDGGRAALVFTAARAAELIATLQKHQFEPKRLRFVHPYVDRPATTILIEARKRGGIEVQIEPPLILYEVPGVYTAEARRLLLDPPSQL